MKRIEESEEELGKEGARTQTALAAVVNPNEAKARPEFQSADYMGVLIVAMLLNAFLLLRYSYAQYDLSRYSTYDLGIFDQATWLISRFKTPNVTIRGCHILGDHFSLILYLCAPFYWIWSSPKTLLTLQTLTLTTGALPIYFLAKSRTSSGRTGLIAGLAYLCCPAVIGENLREFHPECLATSWLVWAFYFASIKKWTPCFVFVVLASMCKETAGYVIVLFGVYVYIKSRGLGTCITLYGIASIFISMTVIQFFNGGHPSAYWIKFSDFGSSPLEIAAYVSTHPLQVFHHANNYLTRAYFYKLLSPLLFLPLLAPEVLLIGLPVILMYVLDRNEGLVNLSLENQYSAYITPFLCCAAVIGYDRWRKFGNRWTSLLIGAVLIGQISILAINNSSFIYAIIAGQPDKYDEIKIEARNVYDRMIPENASVCIEQSQTAQLSRRVRIYSFPNPFFSVGMGNSVDALLQQTGKNFPPFDLQEVRNRIDRSDVEYVVIGNCYNFWPLENVQSKLIAQEIVMSHRYSIIYTDHRMLILKLASLKRSDIEWKSGIDLLASKMNRSVKGSENILEVFSKWFDEAIS